MYGFRQAPICPTKFQIQSDRIATSIEFIISNLVHYTVPDSLTCVKFKQQTISYYLPLQC